MARSLLNQLVAKVEEGLGHIRKGQGGRFEFSHEVYRGCRVGRLGGEWIEVTSDDLQLLTDLAARMRRKNYHVNRSQNERTVWVHEPSEVLPSHIF